MTDQSFRFRKLGYVALNVTDLDRSLAFYRDIFGLDVSEVQPGKVAFLRSSRDHHNFVIHQSAEPGLKRIGFEMESADDVGKAAARLAELGIAYRELPAHESDALHQGRTLRFRMPALDVVFELYDNMMQMPSEFSHRVADILRLGHVVLGTPNVDDTAAWLLKEFQFRESDHIEQGFFAFLRCFPNPYHHSLALTHSPVNKLHHVAFMVKDVGDIGRALHRFPKQNVKVVYGPGRHIASGSVFYYFLDPDGLTVEYTYGMEEFPETAPRPSRMLVRSPATADEWGSLPQDGYGKIGKIENAGF